MPTMQYYNPVDDVFGGRVGRKLDDPGTLPRLFEDYFCQVRDDEVMYVGLRGAGTPPKLIAYANTKESYEVFYGYYYSGKYADFDVYALPATAVEE